MQEAGIKNVGNIWVYCTQYLYISKLIRATFKMFQFGQAQGGRKFQPQEYIKYFEDSAKG